MTSYPFDRVWHNGRGIVFATDKSPVQTSLGTPRSMPMSTTVEVQVDEVTYKSIEEDLNEDAESFTTAPEEFTDDSVVPGVEDTEAAQAIVEEIPLPVLAAPVPPWTKLEYNVSIDAYSAAQEAEEGSMESFWSYKLYRGPVDDDGKETNVTVHYCTSKETMERVCELFVGEEVLGFDLEWKPSATRQAPAKDNCSLIQIASPSRIALFHVAFFTGTDVDDLVAPTFKELMENPEVRKAGVNVKGDSTRLRNYLGIDMQGAFELSHMYKLVRYSETRSDLINRRLVALGTQVKDCLGLPMFKDLDVRRSDWSHRRLNMKQIYYSASDAYAGLQLYHVLDEMRQAMKPTPPRPHHLELNLPIRLAEPEVEESEEDIVDSSDVAADADVAAVTEEFPGYPTLKLTEDLIKAKEAEPPSHNDDTSKT
ncbi:ribonuclease H-like domain-containing protein [Plectosphaerella plurivora]|uniref:Ribonuclease H-like domain-containing protein n=1 Tax=Plectosphaerella plurivora TaxID=936078 RepID=A0A9P9AB77_9PEZI|nr:ribonuclease H-like domain-containing protein [Plectosphaerella plurivora]